MPTRADSSSRSLRLFEIATTDDDRIVEHADWVEANTFFRDDRSVSPKDLERSIVQALSVSDETGEDYANDAFKELESRSSSCGISGTGSSYPFKLETDLSLICAPGTIRGLSDAQLAYVFLLLVSRMDMDSSARVLGGIDPAKVFESICANALRIFMGDSPPLTDSMVFGTSRTEVRTFRAAIDQLCQNLSEGGGWKAGARAPRGGDGKLDIVVWKRFQDGRVGSLVGFAQCKTGIHWRKGLANLQPESFCRKFMATLPHLTPFRSYMVPHRITAARWNDDTADGGLLFDRCRLVEYSKKLPLALRRQCVQWIDSVFTAGRRARTARRVSGERRARKRARAK